MRYGFCEKKKIEIVREKSRDRIQPYFVRLVGHSDFSAMGDVHKLL